MSQACGSSSCPGREHDPEFPASICTLEAGHLGFHADHKCEWWHPENDSRRHDSETAIADAKELYAGGRIAFREFELAVGAALR